MILIINMKWNASGVLSLDVLESVSEYLIQRSRLLHLTYSESLRNFKMDNM